MRGFRENTISFGAFYVSPPTFADLAATRKFGEPYGTIDIKFNFDSIFVIFVKKYMFV